MEEKKVSDFRVKIIVCVIVFIAACCIRILYSRAVNSLQNNESVYFHVTTEFKDYRKLQRQIVSDQQINTSSSSLPPSVVFYRSRHVGYGNRIYSMLSAFMSAVLTDSALVIKWPQIDSYIDCSLPHVFSPFYGQGLLDFNQKSPPICRIKTRTLNTWSYYKRIEIFESILYLNQSLNRQISKLNLEFFFSRRYQVATQLHSILVVRFERLLFRLGLESRLRQEARRLPVCSCANCKSRN